MTDELVDRVQQSLGEAFTEARNLVAGWETRAQARPSQPQIYLGGGSSSWLGALERRIPAGATQPVGRPAVESVPAAASRS